MNQAMLLSRNVRTFYPPSLGPYQNWDWPALFDAVLSVLRTPADRNAWAAAIETVKGFAPQMVVSEPVLAAAWRRFVLLYPMHPQDYALYYMRILLAWAGRYTEARTDPRTSDQVEQEWQSLEGQKHTEEVLLLEQHAQARQSLEGGPALGDLGLSPREREEWLRVQASILTALKEIVGPRGRTSWTTLSLAQMQKLDQMVKAAQPGVAPKRLKYLIGFELKRRRIRLRKPREVVVAERAAAAAKGAATVTDLATAALTAALGRMGIRGPTLISTGQYTKLATSIIPREIKRLARLLPTAALVVYSKTGRVLRRGRRARPYIEREARKQALAQLKARGYERGPQPKEIRSCAARGVIGALRGRRMPVSNFERKRVGSRYVNTGAPLRILSPAQYNELVSASIKRIKVTCRQVKQTNLQWKMAVERELKSRNYLPTAEQTRQARQAAQVKPPVAPVTVAKPKKAPSPWWARRMAQAAARRAVRGPMRSH